MRHALVIAGGSGTRLWPMSRASLPKQLIPFIAGRSLLQLAVERLAGLVPPDRCYVCAGRAHEAAIRHALPSLTPGQFFGEPCGRDTLNAVGLAAAVVARRDAEAVIGVFTADHIIEPIEQFQTIVESGYTLAQQRPETLVTFGIAPTSPVIGFGYLELGEPLGGLSQFSLGENGTVPFEARRVRQFREKPDLETARRYLAAGPEKYLWNSGTFVWRASTLLECIRRFAPENYAGLMQIAAAWETPRRDAALDEVFPALRKISVDYAVMEPASRDPAMIVAAIPMQLPRWLDVGSWPAFAETCPCDENENSIAAERVVLMDTRGTLAASSDPKHLIAAIGCEDLIIVHTSDATLVCRRDCADAVKELHRQITEQFGPEVG